MWIANTHLSKLGEPIIDIDTGCGRMGQLARMVTKHNLEVPKVGGAAPAQRIRCEAKLLDAKRTDSILVKRPENFLRVGQKSITWELM